MGWQNHPVEVWAAFWWTPACFALSVLPLIRHWAQGFRMCLENKRLRTSKQICNHLPWDDEFLFWELCAARLEDSARRYVGNCPSSALQLPCLKIFTLQSRIHSLKWLEETRGQARIHICLHIRYADMSWKKEENEEWKVKAYLEFIGLSAKVLKGASFGLILSWVARENYSLVISMHVNLPAAIATFFTIFKSRCVLIIYTVPSMHVGVIQSK